ncbi:MAG TPA: NAD(P)-dependent oxidoreductase [Verrucomicrobiae bacterium]|nr:NAD(P)-dependent oxidoreductase [Verrucomicrobiae bacterium]
MKILITGAAGNLGSLLARYLLAQEVGSLRLMVFRRDVPANLKVKGKTEIVRADLLRRESLTAAVKEVDVIVHFAGVLFKANPERFLSTTNTEYFKNLADVAKEKGVRRIILISFPHVEGPTSIDKPAKGRLDGTPISVHAKTRLEEERYLFANATEPISLRVGMVYGRGILMIDAARWLAKRRLLGVWKERTQIQLISKDDFCSACTAAITNRAVSGIYHLGDEGNVSLQEFLELACRQWDFGRPWTMPLWLIYAAAELCELYSRMTGSISPLTRDFIDIGRVSYYGDTERMRKDLLPVLKHPTIAEGLSSL